MKGISAKRTGKDKKEKIKRVRNRYTSIYLYLNMK